MTKERTMNEIVVGNIGNVYSGYNDDEALRIYLEYVDQSKIGYGRAAGESVVWFRDGEIWRSMRKQGG